MPSLCYGALCGAVWTWAAIPVAGMIGGEYGMYLSLSVTGLFIVFLCCYFMAKSPLLSSGSLAVFNGLTLFLAANGTNSIPAIGPIENPYFAVLSALVWVSIVGLFGWFLGFLTVTLTFPVKRKG